MITVVNRRYITNIPADRLAAEDISSTYALRW